MKRIATLAAAAALVFAAGCSKDDEAAGEGGEAAGAETEAAGDDAGASAHASAPSPHGSAARESGVSVEDGVADFGRFTMQVPEAWTYSAPSSRMRKAQFELPAEGDAESAELVVYYFGASGAGGVEANVKRWVGQFKQADGASSREAAEIEKQTISGLEVTTVDVSGRYVASMRPNAGKAQDKADYRMLAAIAGTPSGPHYFKLVGPKATVTAHEEAFDGFISSIALAD